MPTDSAKQATLYRMVMDKHICPFGLKSLDLLKREGYEVEDKCLLALAISWMSGKGLLSIRTAELFIALSMSILALLKLQDVESFSTMFLNYDLLARRVVPYSYVYPFGELLAGVLMVAGAMLWLAIPVALFIGTVGAVSVLKAVYIDKRELKCACVGGGSNVPLGFVSLTENLMMIAMGLWMFRYF